MANITSRVEQVLSLIHKAIDGISPEEIKAAGLSENYFHSNESTAGAFFHILMERDQGKSLPHIDDLKAAILEVAQAHSQTAEKFREIHELAGRVLNTEEQERYTALLQTKEIQEAIDGSNPVQLATNALENRERLRRDRRQENLSRSGDSHAQRAQSTGGKKTRQV